jgi:hypothetical protein
MSAPNTPIIAIMTLRAATVPSHLIQRNKEATK